MTRCERCGKIMTNREEVTLVRTPTGHWQIHCLACVRGAGQATSKTDKPIRAAPAAKTAGSFDAIIAKIGEIMEQMERETAPPRQYKRAHERHGADLVVRYALLRDDDFYTARFKDVSEGGACFITDRELQPRQIIRFEIDSGKMKEAPVLVQSAGEVRRVAPLGDGRFEVGIRFVKRLRAQEPNRRRYRRVRVDLAAYFRRNGSDLVEKGRVLDISQGGVRLLVDAGLTPGDEMDVIVRGEGAAAGKTDIHGKLRVVRAVLRRHGATEAGCTFLALRLRSHLIAPQETP